MPQDGHHKCKMAKPKIAPTFSVLRLDFACLELKGQSFIIRAENCQSLIDLINKT